jgi:hypothetical protein
MPASFSVFHSTPKSTLASSLSRSDRVGQRSASASLAWDSLQCSRKSRSSLRLVSARYASRVLASMAGDWPRI